MMIRGLEKNDKAQLLCLLEAMVGYHRAIDRYYKQFSEYKNWDEEIDSWLKDKDTRLLAGEIDGELAGYARIAVESAPDYAAAKKIGVIYDVFVLEQYRRQGIADALCTAALEWLQKKKVKHIELSVDARNEAGIALWKKLGFFSYKLRLRKDL
jgi:ribosomal protein S18 acetylase RimI-like enzyme